MFLYQFLQFEVSFQLHYVLLLLILYFLKMNYELSHTTAYKKNVDVDPLIKRKLARSMALIEATDELFKEVQELLFKEDVLFNDYIRTSKKYTDFSRMTLTINRFIYDAYKEFLNSKEVKSRDVEALISELSSYISGLSNDIEAVKNAITLKYNNGLAEGNVNKLKVIKRIMYGRNSFELLKAKLLRLELRKIN